MVFGDVISVVMKNKTGKWQWQCVWVGRGQIVCFSSMQVSHGCNTLSQIWSLRNNENLFFHSYAGQVLNIKGLASPCPFRGFRRDSTPRLFRLLVSVGIPFSWLLQSCLFFFFFVPHIFYSLYFLLFVLLFCLNLPLPLLFTALVIGFKPYLHYERLPYLKIMCLITSGKTLLQVK